MNWWIAFGFACLWFSIYGVSWLEKRNARRRDEWVREQNELVDRLIAAARDRSKNGDDVTPPSSGEA